MSFHSARAVPLTAFTVRLKAGEEWPHHDGLEWLFVHRGPVVLAQEDRRAELGDEQIALFWAALPRRCLEPGGAVATRVEIPLERAFAWGLPEALVRRLLHGEIVFGLAGDVEGTVAMKWEDDLESDDRHIVRAASLEIEAAVLRLARRSTVLAAPTIESTAVQRAVSAILGRLAEPLGVAEVAREMGLHPSHAMRQFRRATGASIRVFIERHRLARVKRLLIESAMPVSQVAAESGFASERRFFAVFRRETGTTPSAYRRLHRRPSAR